MKFFDGMEARVVQKGKNYLYLATREFKVIDYLTMGYWPKPNYEQIGVFNGDTTGIEEGAVVKVFFKKEQGLKKAFKEFLMTYSNIERVELIKSHEPITRLESIKRACSLKVED